MHNGTYINNNESNERVKAIALITNMHLKILFFKKVLNPSLLPLIVVSLTGHLGRCFLAGFNSETATASHKFNSTNTLGGKRIPLLSFNGINVKSFVIHVGL